VKIKDKNENEVASFYGRKKTISVIWEGKGKDGKVVPDGQYFCEFTAGGISKTVPFLIDKRKGAGNPSIEKLGFWMPMHWGGYYPGEKESQAKDYDVSYTGTYSLRIIRADSISDNPILV